MVLVSRSSPWVVASQERGCLTGLAGRRGRGRGAWRRLIHSLLVCSALTRSWSPRSYRAKRLWRLPSSQLSCRTI